MIDKERFGPWVLVTGASSGIGRELARQLAADGLDLVLAARRAPLLRTVAEDLTRTFGVECRTVEVDLSREGALDAIERETRSLNVGLVISNAGTPFVRRFLDADRPELDADVRLNALSHLDLAQHFAPRLAALGRGGLMLVGALGGSIGVPFMAVSAASKAFLLSLGEALHVELEPRGVTVTVLTPGPVQTDALELLGLEGKLPMKALSVEQCAREALSALAAGRSRITPGRLTRIMHSLVPASVNRRIAARVFGEALRDRPRATASHAR
ncbi:MAG TPA: SDR family NAD(P)-dependent oxidoreductase [Planctomycetota bacterium]|nr:SDR family NAD(P)-dependent oxidoreductase [Planctomycetota bacterium]